MGLFSKRRPEPAAPVPDHIVADSAELAKARGVLADFERSQMTGGTDGQARAAVMQIARAGSLPDAPAWADSEREFNVRAMRAISARGDTGTQRVWSWLAAVSESAAMRGDHDLVARVTLFAAFWMTILSPNLTINDEMDMRLPRGAPDEPLGRLLSVGLWVLPTMDPQQLVVADHPGHQNSMTVHDVLVMCAVTARDSTARLDPDVSALPSRLLVG